MAQSRLAAQTHQHSGAHNSSPSLGPSVSDDEELKAAMALSEAEAKQAAKGKAVMKRTPTEEDIERALQESAQLATTAPTRKQQHYNSASPHTSGQGSSQADQDAADADLARALYESQQLASASASSSSSHAPYPMTSAKGPTPEQTGSSRLHSPSATMMPSPAAAPHVQHSSFPASSPSPSRLSHQQPQSSASATPAQATTGSIRYPDIYHPGSSSSQAPSSSQSQQYSPRLQHSSHEQPQGQGQSQQPTQQRLQASSQHQRQPQHRGSSSGGAAGGLYIDGYHGSANLESMLSADEAFARALHDAELQAAAAGQVSQASLPPPSQQKASPTRQQHQHPPSRPQAPPASQQGSSLRPVAVDKPGMCPGCDRSLRSLGSDISTISTGGRTWHASCFRCGACQQPIDAGIKIGVGKEDRLPYHLDCYRTKFDPRCAVCHDLMPCDRVNLGPVSV